MPQNISKGRGLENQEPSLPPYRSAGRAEGGIGLAIWTLGIYREFEEWVCKILIKCSDISHCTVRPFFGNKNSFVSCNVSYNVYCYKKEIWICSLCTVAVGQDRTPAALM